MTSPIIYKGMRLLVFIPGYMTSAECTSTHDTYHAIMVSSLEHKVPMHYISMPNNNYGDSGNTTIDACLEYAIVAYNKICDANTNQDILLAGHSMGGFLALRMVSTEVAHRLRRPPVNVRVINPGIYPSMTNLNRLLGTMLSFLPEMLLRLLSIPGTVAEYSALYPESPCMDHNIKQRLAVSFLQRTCGAYVHNDTWNITPAPSLIRCIRVIQCMGDTIVSPIRSSDYARTYNVEFVPVYSNYHELLDDKIISHLWRP
jgi:hypothetical protein